MSKTYLPALFVMLSFSIQNWACCSAETTVTPSKKYMYLTLSPDELQDKLYKHRLLLLKEGTLLANSQIWYDLACAYGHLDCYAANIFSITIFRALLHHEQVPLTIKTLSARCLSKIMGLDENTRIGRGKAPARSHRYGEECSMFNRDGSLRIQPFTYLGRK